MLRQVSNGQYIDAIRMAEKFILHVEVLFAAIDDLEYHFARQNMKGALLRSLPNHYPTPRFIHEIGWNGSSTCSNRNVTCSGSPHALPQNR